MGRREEKPLAAIKTSQIEDLRRTDHPPGSLQPKPVGPTCCIFQELATMWHTQVARDRNVYATKHSFPFTSSMLFNSVVLSSHDLDTSAKVSHTAEGDSLLAQTTPHVHM